MQNYYKRAVKPSYTMVKKPHNRKRKRDRNFVAIPYTAQLALSTLGDGTVLASGTFSANFGEDIFIVSIDGNWAIAVLTAGEVPIEVGYAHSDLSVSEIKEALEAELTDPDDIIAKEHARRPVRRAGQFGAGSVSDYEVS